MNDFGEDLKIMDDEEKERFEGLDAKLKRDYLEFKKKLKEAEKNKDLEEKTSLEKMTSGGQAD